MNVPHRRVTVKPATTAPLHPVRDRVDDDSGLGQSGYPSSKAFITTYGPSTAITMTVWP